MKYLQVVIVLAFLATPSWPAEVSSALGVAAQPSGKPSAAKPSANTSVEPAVPSGEHVAILRRTPTADVSPAWRGNAVVFFGAEWCGPCRALEPMRLRLHAKALRQDWHIYVYDVDRKDFTWQPAPPMMPLPFVVLYRDNVEVRRWRWNEIDEKAIEDAASAATNQKESSK